MDQTCPHCRRVNKVAGMFDAGKIDGKAEAKFWCGFCRKRFAPTGAEQPKAQTTANPFLGPQG